MFKYIRAILHVIRLIKSQDSYIKMADEHARMKQKFATVVEQNKKLMVIVEKDKEIVNMLADRILILQDALLK